MCVRATFHLTDEIQLYCTVRTCTCACDVHVTRSGHTVLPPRQHTPLSCCALAGCPHKVLTPRRCVCCIRCCRHRTPDDPKVHTNQSTTCPDTPCRPSRQLMHRASCVLVSFHRPTAGGEAVTLSLCAASHQRVCLRAPSYSVSTAVRLRSTVVDHVRQVREP